MQLALVLIMHGKIYQNDHHEKGFHSHRFLETRGKVCHAESQGEAPGLVRRQEKKEESTGRSLYYDFHGKRQGTVGRLGIG